MAVLSISWTLVQQKQAMIALLFYVCVAMLDVSQETDVSVTLYSRKVMIMPKANHILPRWLRFLKGMCCMSWRVTFLEKGQQNREEVQNRLTCLVFL